jgi:hypothetical protein
MNITSKIALATALAALAACGSNKNANNAAEYNATDMNAGMTDLNATENATTEMNATANMEMNATGNAASNAAANTATNNAY